MLCLYESAGLCSACIGKQSISKESSKAPAYLPNQIYGGSYLTPNC